MRAVAYQQLDAPTLSDRELVGNEDANARKNRTGVSREPDFTIPPEAAALASADSPFTLETALGRTDNAFSGASFARPLRGGARYDTELLQQWIGTVVELSEDQFVATLKDVFDVDHPEERATFDKNEVSDADHVLIERGAVFYWGIGYNTDKQRNGQKILMSAIRFRRLPAWSAGDVERAKKEASRFDRLFKDPT